MVLNDSKESCATATIHECYNPMQATKLKYQEGEFYMLSSLNSSCPSPTYTPVYSQNGCCCQFADQETQGLY